MSRPLQKGDLCEVVDGLGQRRSPNLGLLVTVGQRIGEHSRFGVIWSCTGAGVQQLTDGGGYVVTGEAGFAQAWLRRIEPDALPAQALEQAMSL